MSETLVIEEEEITLRLDQLLSKRYQGHFSRTYFQKLIQDELVLLNGAPVKKRFKPKVGDEIEVEFRADPEIKIAPENIPLEILYEDDDLLVVNKPAGMVVHPAPGNWSGTFVNALVYHCQTLLNEKETLRPGIVHRLDKDTSGLLVAAKHSEAQRRLIAAFAERRVHKEYEAIVVGAPKEQTIDLPIGRSVKDRQKMATSSTGRPARTHIKILKRAKELSHLRIALETGRTHQIRVHLNAIGTPVLGDELYGIATANRKYKASRQLLHAAFLSFIHPFTHKRIEFTIPPPKDFIEILNLHLT